MKVLWLCNIVLPVIAKEIGVEESNKEGWLSGISEALLAEKENKITLGICFPTAKEQDGINGTVQGISYYGFQEDVLHPENYDVGLEERLKYIVEQFQPDIVHIFGTEFPHTLAMAKIFDRRERLLISVQGICGECAKRYTLGIPDKICRRFTFRDFLKRDNILQQQEKFVMRGLNEKAAFLLAGHVAGRTAWDRDILKRQAKWAKYHLWKETLRGNFYKEEWKYENCEKHTIFMSQGNYPIKGLHLALEALPEIVEKYPDTKLLVAGDKITAYASLKEKIKIGGYGKYVLELIHKNGLEENVVFLGKLDAEEMCRQFLSSHVFLSASVLENSPNSVGEAMLLGVPVVSSRVGGVESLLEDKKEGLLYEAEDTKQLADNILQLLGDEVLAERVSEAARKRAKITHDPQTNYRRLLEIYNEINLCV